MLEGVYCKVRITRFFKKNTMKYTMKSTIKKKKEGVHIWLVGQDPGPGLDPGSSTIVR